MNTLTAMSAKTSTQTPLPTTHPPATARNPQELAEKLHEGLLTRHGPVLGGADLARALGYRSLAAFRQARRRGQVDIALFTLPNRRGVFALTLVVATWLAHTYQANQVVSDTEEPPISPPN